MSCFVRDAKNCTIFISEPFLSFQAKLQWTRQNPVSFSSFRNTLYGSSEIEKYTYDFGEMGGPSPATYRRPRGMRGVDMTKIKQAATSTVSPTSEPASCFLLLLSNKADPNWLNINCSSQWLRSIICIKDYHNASMERNAIDVADTPNCFKDFVRFGRKCLAFFGTMFPTSQMIMYKYWKKDAKNTV